MSAISETRTTRGNGLWIRLLGAAVGLVFAVTPSDVGAYYYGHHYGGYYGSYYGPHYGGHYGSYYAPYYGGGYSGHHYPGSCYGLGCLVYGILSIPAHVVGAIFGYHPHDGRYDGGHATTGGSTPAATPRATESGGSGGAGGYNGGSGATDNGGWSRLAEGRYSQALAIFANEARSRPTEGRPKVGYALSAAAGGDLGRGVWAMRRALRIDPEAVNYLTMDSIDQALRPRVEAIIASYVEDPYETLDDAEATFMLASLYYLLGESESARNAIKVANAGDDSLPSTANLKHLIDLAPADRGAAGTTKGESPGGGY